MPMERFVIRQLCEDDKAAIYQIINTAAQAYKGIIPADRYHEPYMPEDELSGEMERMTFFGWESGGEILGVMGFQPVKDVTLIRHAYVLPAYQKQGVGTKLLQHIKKLTKTRLLLVGTWADADWALAFYRRQGFTIMPGKNGLLSKYWNLPVRQIETSVVLGIETGIGS
jgi:GNAT superfamily N-acetyltransferase